MERSDVLKVSVGLLLVVLVAGCVNSTTSQPNGSENDTTGDVPNSSVNSSIADDLEEASDETSDQTSDDGGSSENPFQSLMEEATEEDGGEANDSDGADQNVSSGQQADDGSKDDESPTAEGPDLDSLGTADGEDGADAVPGSQGSVEVVDVVTADKLRVSLDDGTTTGVRLIGVQAPPTDGPVLTDDYPTIENIRRQKECVRQWGESARDHVRQDLVGEEVELVYDEDVQNQKQYIGRQAYLVVDGQNYNRGLLEDGYVRVFNEGFSRQFEFQQVGKRARQENQGLWQCASGGGDAAEDAGIVVTDMQAEVPQGSDQQNLNQEWVELKNTGETTIDMEGWSISTEGSRGYNFPEGFELRPGATVKIRSGNSFSFRSADQHARDLYWGSISPVWKNGGGTVVVRDSSFKVRIEHDY